MDDLNAERAGLELAHQHDDAIVVREDLHVPVSHVGAHLRVPELRTRPSRSVLRFSPACGQRVAL